MICIICNETHAEKSGAFLKHIKREHNLSSVTEYYYSININDPCIICNKDNKTIKNWSLLKLETCSNKECIEKHRTNKISKAQHQLYNIGKGQFQRQELRDKNTKTMAEMALKGIHPFQNIELKQKLKIKLLIRNNTNNPMKNKETAKKMAESSKGKILSDSHKQNIGKGLSAYLSSLSTEDFATRMNNTNKPKEYIECINKSKWSHV